MPAASQLQLRHLVGQQLVRDVVEHLLRREKPVDRIAAQRVQVLLERCRIGCPRILAGLSKRLADAPLRQRLCHLCGVELGESLLHHADDGAPAGPVMPDEKIDNTFGPCPRADLNLASTWSDSLESSGTWSNFLPKASEKPLNCARAAAHVISETMSNHFMTYDCPRLEVVLTHEMRVVRSMPKAAAVALASPL